MLSKSYNFSKNSAIPLIFLWALTLSVRMGIGPRTVDDAYITFRYARNLMNGAGFVYNHGEKVLGTTTPLFTIILAISSLVSDNLEIVAIIINSIADAATAALLYLIAFNITQRPKIALLTALLWVFSAGSIRFTTGGMETGVFVFLILYTCWLYSRGNHILAGIMAGMAILVRPEGIILAGLIVAISTVTYARLNWGILVAIVGIILPWLVFATLYFGSPVPNSILAKGSSSAFPAMTALKSLLGYLPDYVLPLDNLQLTRFMKYGFTAIVLTLGFIASFFAKRSPNLLPLGLFPILYVGAYAVANPPVWEWYTVPLVPFACLAVTLGTAKLFDLAASHFRSLRFVGQGWPFPVLILLCTAGMFQTFHIGQKDIRQEREIAYISIARKLGGSSFLGKTIATPEIGALGYYLPNARMVDTQGLVSPQAISYRKEIVANLDLSTSDFQAIWYASINIPVRLILDTPPDFVISPDAFAGLLTESETFNARYDVVLEEPSHVFGSQRIVVFQLNQYR